MEILGIKYIAPCFDNSGYAKASRGNILALHKLGVPITLSPISFEKARPDLGAEGEILKSLINKKVPYNILIMHCTPEFWAKQHENNVTNIGYTIWETSKLHPDWPKYINASADKVLVGCTWNKETFKFSGVTKPIGVVPHGINIEEYEKPIERYQIAGVDPNAYVFYSVFQWTERKNPNAMIKAYWHAFQKGENVALVLKTYRNSYDDSEKQVVRELIKGLKKNTPMDSYPPLFYIPDMLSEYEIKGLHARGNCYVSFDRGEGFGLGPFEAGASGNPIIITGYGGAREYAKEHNSYLINYTLTPVSGMWWSPWYRGDQLWAEPDVKNGADLMYQVFNHQDDARAKGQTMKADIKENFSWEAIGKRLMNELEKI
jgi:glycosyltransferase involved in cell wall biosynthesis